MSYFFQQRLSLPALSRIRRNHGLEHATINVLSERFPNTTLIGRTDRQGFYLYGQVPTEALRQAVDEALARLRGGEHSLAIHPNCGTNLVTSGILTGMASFFSLFGSKDEGWRERLERLPLAIAVSTLALIISQPIGRAAQQHLTTQPDPGPLEVLSVHSLRSDRVKIHRVLTRN